MGFDYEAATVSFRVPEVIHIVNDTSLDGGIETFLQIELNAHVADRPHRRQKVGSLNKAGVFLPGEESVVGCGILVQV